MRTLQGLLGLVVNVLVLWTTQYMDLALAHLREQGMEIREEDMVRLSPLGYRHIHLQGRYNVPLSEAVHPVGFRALRTTTEPDEVGDDYSA